MKKIFTLISLFVLALSVQADNETYTLDLNKVYQDAVNQTGDCANATLNSGTKYLLNDATVKQDPFTIVSKSNRTYRIDVIQTDAESQIVPVKYSDDYSASYRLEPNGASNNTGGRQTFLEAEGAGKLTIGAWGGEGRTFAVIKATDKTSYYNVANATDDDYKHAFTKDETKPVVNDVAQVFEIDIPKAGIYCITQDAGIYFGYMSFTQTGSGGGDEPSEPGVPATWDFSKFEDKVSLHGDGTTAKSVEYDGLTLVGIKDVEPEAGPKDYVSAAAGFHANGASNSSRRYIKYTPVADGTLKVTFKSNTAGATDRITAIGTVVSTFTDITAAPASVLKCAYTADPDVTIEADVVANTTYYMFFASGGQSITKVEYIPAGSTGIKSAKVAVVKTGVTYNLAGQQVGADYKGVVIKDGKKVMQ